MVCFPGGGGGEKDIRAPSCYFKGTPKKFIGSVRGKFGEITESITLEESQSKMISRWENGSGRSPLGDWNGRGKAKYKIKRMNRTIHLDKTGSSRICQTSF